MKGEYCFVCSSCTAICAKINICHLFSAALTNESLQPAAFALQSVKGRVLFGEKVCSLNAGHRQGLYPLLATANTLNSSLNENKILSSKLHLASLQLKRSLP